MSLIPSSKGTTLLVALVIAVAAVGTAAAVTVDNASADPQEAQVGQEVTAEVTLTDLYQPDADWTLRGTTQLQNITSWQVVKTYPNGTSQSQTFEGQEQFEVSVTSSANFESITVTVTGDAPAVETFSYDPPQDFEAAKLTKVVGQGESALETVAVHHYTNESQNAREAIDAAEDAVNGTNNAEAESDLQNAIDWYDEGDFEKAINNAESAEENAKQAKQSQDTMQLVLYAVGAIVVLALIGGGVYYFRNQQDSYDKLR